MRQIPGATASEVSLITGHFGYPGSSPKRNALSSSTRDAKIEEAQQVLGLGQALPPELLAAKPKRLRFLIFNRAGRSCTMPARWCAGCGIWARRFAAGEPPSRRFPHPALSEDSNSYGRIITYNFSRFRRQCPPNRRPSGQQTPFLVPSQLSFALANNRVPP